MATTHGSASPDFHTGALTYVVIPLAVVVTLGVIAVLLHTHRRKRLLKRRLQNVGSSPGARRALERDLQEAWARGAPQEDRRQQRRAMVRGSRNNPNGAAGGRWAWARELLTARGEEGLNEYGEAPPPYDGRRRASKTQEEVDAVELDNRTPGSRNAGTNEPQSPDLEAGQSSQQQGRRSSGQGLPPAYDGPSTAATAGSHITVPAPALTRDSDLRHPSA